jgi:hypothetical protein
LGGQLLAVLGVLVANRLRHHPHRILLAADDLGRAFGSLPTHLADADGMREHDLRLALFVRRIIENAHGGDVHHHALMRSRRQHELRRHHHLAADTRQPGIDAGIRRQHFLVAHVEAPRNVGQRVLLADDRLLHIAHDVGCRARPRSGAWRWAWAVRSRRRRSLTTGGGGGGRGRNSEQAARPKHAAANG